MGAGAAGFVCLPQSQSQAHNPVPRFHTFLQTLQAPTSIGLRIIHANDIHARWAGAGGELHASWLDASQTARPSYRAVSGAASYYYAHTACTHRVCHVMAWAACRIEPADANFNLASPDKYNGSYGGLPRMAGYIARARIEAAAAQQDILVLHAGGLWCRATGGRLAGRLTPAGTNCCAPSSGLCSWTPRP